jgi:hypothetical protein
MRIVGRSALLGLAACVACSADLINPGFETPGGDGWSFSGTWGAAGSWRDGGVGDAHSGANGATFDALDSLAGDSYFVLHQELAASEGQLWTVSGWLRTVNLGNEDSESWMEVQFWNGADSVIGQAQSAHLTADQDWIQMSLPDLLAPAGTAKISVRGVVYIDPAGTSQTEFHLFDDFEASVVPEPGSITMGLFGLGLVAGLRSLRTRRAPPAH